LAVIEAQAGGLGVAGPAAHTRLIGVAAAEIRPICDRSHRF
jgi:hypothetical protein